MSSYTCISCRVSFSDSGVQRAHYRSDWHRYNLKRKVADMPPVTADNFQERVLAQRAAAEQQQLSGSAVQSCATCCKRFSSPSTFQNHLQSHKHQQAEKRALQDAQRKVEKLNQKNLEKGLGEEKVDHDARNQALQQALRQQRKLERGPAGATGWATGGAVGEAAKQRLEKPPRLLWFEEQARRMEKEEEMPAEEEEWEDVHEGEDDEDEEEEEEDMGDGDEPRHAPLPGSLPVSRCLFCPQRSRSLFRNVAHMTRAHGFFIPDLEYLVDLEGLVRHLGEKVGAGKVCLWCNEKGRSFYSTDAVQGHMVDKSHCRMLTDGDAALEFADFYDFRSSYPDRKEEEDAEMEDEDAPSNKNLEFDEDTLELTLPSGARIGHRSLMRYYKQRFGAQRQVVLAHNRKAVGRVLRQYQALGWTGGTGGSVVQRSQKDMRYVQRMKSRWTLKMGISHNSTKQNHFRAQVMF